VNWSAFDPYAGSDHVELVRGIGGVPPPRASRRGTASALVMVEPMTGIEPAYSAWEADVLPLNYIGGVAPEG
jgi:hypothetical protein